VKVRTCIMIYTLVSWSSSWYFKDIEAINGKVRIKLEEGIQSGKILRLKGKGIPNINGYASGDLLVHVNVWTPKTVSKEQKSCFEDNIEDEHFIPNPENQINHFWESKRYVFNFIKFKNYVPILV
jgi:molecular chaperone DnaJ